MTDASDYHEQTSYTLQGLRETDTSLDHENKPTSAKSYIDLPRVSPDSDPEAPAMPALEAIRMADSNGVEDPMTPDIHTLCQYATGVTKTIDRRGSSVSFRAASCTGRLYHVDLYAVCGDSVEPGPGVYHYAPEDDAFDVLRTGDYRGLLAAATGDSSGVEDAPVTFVATSQWWRNAWKYRDRMYRHAFWDSGTILANLLAVAHATGQRASVVTGFTDDTVLGLLGLDADREAPLELVPVGAGDPAPESPELDVIDPDEAALSRNPIHYPLVTDAWKQSTLADGNAVTDWRDKFDTLTRDDVGRNGVGDGNLIEMDPVDTETASGRPLGNTIERRGSLREWPHETISDRMLATVLDRALGPIPLDGLGQSPDGVDSVLDYYVLVHAVDDVPQGAYQYHQDEGVLERIGETDRQTAAEIALQQDVVGDASVNVYAMADVEAIVDALGNRGYRVAQLEAGIALGRLYLATYAHRRLGGRGFTFLDGRVTDHLSPRASNQAPMTLYAFGNRPD